MRRRVRGIGQGGRIRTQKRRRVVRAPRRQFTARTLGPLTGESKYFDSEVSATAIDEGVAWVAANDLTKGVMAIPKQGTSAVTRVGRRIEIYKLAIRGTINQTVSDDATSIFASATFRVILWIDTQTNGTVTTSASLMQAPATAATPAKFNTFQNIANFGRFRVLKDITLIGPNLDSFNDQANAANSTGTVCSPNLPFKIVHKFSKSLVVKFQANAGAIGDVVDNSVYLSIAKSTTAGDHTVTYQCRCYFKDK